MLSVIIPTDGVEQTAVATLSALVPGAASGVVREVLLVDRTDNDVIERVEVKGLCGEMSQPNVVVRQRPTMTIRLRSSVREERPSCLSNLASERRASGA